MDIVLRATLAFVFILFLTRIVGRRELSSLEPFDLILLITLGDLVQQGVTQNDFSVTGMMLAAGTIGAMTVLFSYLGWRFERLRPVLEGEPLIVVEDGKPVTKNLRRERLAVVEIAAAARQEGITSLEHVQWAVLETSGRISFIQKGS
jgi:uncharacterized membrane protein YcaP (DUF421 family)